MSRHLIIVTSPMTSFIHTASRSTPPHPQQKHLSVLRGDVLELEDQEQTLKHFPSKRISISASKGSLTTQILCCEG
ncbi:hypothetical protein V6N13_132502 [Hibiscus sabdariffa]